jgi:hypothetical protein
VIIFSTIFHPHKKRTIKRSGQVSPIPSSIVVES